MNPEKLIGGFKICCFLLKHIFVLVNPLCTNGSFWFYTINLGWWELLWCSGQSAHLVNEELQVCSPASPVSLLSNATVGALIRNVGPSESMIRLSFNMAAASHTWFRNEEF